MHEGSALRPLILPHCAQQWVRKFAGSRGFATLQVLGRWPRSRFKFARPPHGGLARAVSANLQSLTIRPLRYNASDAGCSTIRGERAGAGRRLPVFRPGRGAPGGLARRGPQPARRPVEALAEGEAEALERFETALRRGPSRARVEHVMIDDGADHGPGQHRIFDRRVATRFMDHLKAKIRHVPDFPKPGILFYDITTLLCDAQGLSRHRRRARRALHGRRHRPGGRHREPRLHPRRGGGQRAGLRLRADPQAGQAAVETHKEDYSLEYGTDALEIHQDACADGQRILIVDDVLATGGTAKAPRSIWRAGPAARSSASRF